MKELIFAMTLNNKNLVFDKSRPEQFSKLTDSAKYNAALAIAGTNMSLTRVNHFVE